MTHRPRDNCITYCVNIIISILSRDWTIEYSSFLLASKISFVSISFANIIRPRDEDGSMATGKEQEIIRA